MKEAINPYAAPGSDVREVVSNEDTSVRLWSWRSRLGRVRYLAYLMALVLLVWLGGSVLGAALALVWPGKSEASMMGLTITLMVLIYGTFLVGSYALAVRRLHDCDTSGWWALLLLVPLVNIVFGFALWFIPGTRGPNRFGPQTPGNGIGVSILAALAPLAVVAYVGIIAAVAIPEYQKYVQKAQEQAQGVEP